MLISFTSVYEFILRLMFACIFFWVKIEWVFETIDHYFVNKVMFLETIHLECHLMCIVLLYAMYYCSKDHHNTFKLVYHILYILKKLVDIYL